MFTTLHIAHSYLVGSSIEFFPSKVLDLADFGKIDKNFAPQDRMLFWDANVFVEHIVSHVPRVDGSFLKKKTIHMPLPKEATGRKLPFFHRFLDCFDTNTFSL